MTTIIKLIVAALVVYAATQVGLSTYKYYNFEDSIHAILLIPQTTDEDIKARILDAAEDQDIPLDPANVQVTRNSREVTATVTYDEGVKLAPGYKKMWTFKPTSSAILMSGVAIPAKPPRAR